MTVSSRTLIALAEKDVGQRETTGPNRSPWLDPIQRFVAKLFGWSTDFLIGQPWCGTWGTKKGNEAGFTSADNPWHPSCESMWVKATANGTLTSHPQPGCAIVWRGIHTGMVVAIGSSVVHTIEGNSGDAVSRRVRPLTGTHRYVVPKTLTQGAPTQTVYYLEDLKAQYTVLGPWRTKVMRDRAYKRLKPARKRVATCLTTGDGRYVIRVGQARHYGPWTVKASRDNAQAVLEKRLARRLRRYSKTRRLDTTTPVGGTAEDLGKTD